MFHGPDLRLCDLLHDLLDRGRWGRGDGRRRHDNLLGRGNGRRRNHVGLILLFLLLVVLIGCRGYCCCWSGYGSRRHDRTQKVPLLLNRNARRADIVLIGNAQETTGATAVTGYNDPRLVELPRNTELLVANPDTRRIADRDNLGVAAENLESINALHNAALVIVELRVEGAVALAELQRLRRRKVLDVALLILAELERRRVEGGNQIAARAWHLEPLTRVGRRYVNNEPVDGLEHLVVFLELRIAVHALETNARLVLLVVVVVSTVVGHNYLGRLYAKALAVVVDVDLAAAVV